MAAGSCWWCWPRKWWIHFGLNKTIQWCWWQHGASSGISDLVQPNSGITSDLPSPWYVGDCSLCCRSWWVTWGQSHCSLHPSSLSLWTQNFWLAIPDIAALFLSGPWPSVGPLPQEACGIKPFFRLQDHSLALALKHFLLLFVLDPLVHACLILFLSALAVGKKSKLLVFIILAVCD